MVARNSKYRSVSLFSGCGGFCEGIEQSGFDVLHAVEHDRFACETYRHNFPDTKLLEGDVREFLRSEKEVAENDLGNLDLLFGGPPCQGYSQIGTRRLDDIRNDLYLEYVRILRRLRPRVFLIENVPNILLLNGGHYTKRIMTALRRAGYGNATFVRVSAADFGVPQDRRRVFFIGTRDDLPFPYDLRDFAESTLDSQRVRNPTTVWDAIGDLPSKVVPSGSLLPYPAKAFSSYQKVMRLDFSTRLYPKRVKRRRGISQEEYALHNHHTKEIQERRLALISILEPGKKADSLPKAVWNGKRPEKWRRLHPDQPAYTLLANMHRDLSEFVHPRLNRWITVREAARLQSFHDGFVFMSSEWQMLKQIGNAVPPLLARAIGNVAHQALLVLGGEQAEIDRPVQGLLRFG